jgi:hypothetical protein
VNYLAEWTWNVPILKKPATRYYGLPGVLGAVPVVVVVLVVVAVPVGASVVVVVVVEVAGGVGFSVPPHAVKEATSARLAAARARF